jgi:hypothetical protein
MKVIGGPMLPVWFVAVSKTLTPVSALYANRRPLFMTWKTRLPAVVSVPPPMLPLEDATRHFSVCVLGSMAMSQLPV